MEHKGTVYFFTGLSGAGKTTVGSLFYQRLKNTKPNAVYLDGPRSFRQNSASMPTGCGDMAAAA